ncbi:MAG TPA: PQQ-binding-like beta-propeller repeat protein, partial [Chitinophagaceae bacterium]|nr:PQQ-binding-like beta-propeller repeat protein [Chitinophagaceae bacterium]
MKKLLLAILFFPLISFADPVPKGNSFQFRGGSNHIGEYEVSDRFGKVSQKWEFHANSAIRSTPLAFENLILFGSGDHQFYAVDSSKGILRWKFTADGPVHSSPAVYSNTVYFNTTSNTLYALDVRSGKLKWKKQLGANLPYQWGFDYYVSSPMIDQKILYTGSGDGNLYALDPLTGNVKWKYNVNARIRSTPATDDKKIYFGDVSGKVYALDKSNGSLAWQFSTIGDTLTNENFGFDRKAVIASPAIASNMVIVGGRDGYLYAINAATGEQTWQFDYQVSWVISSVAIKNNKVVSATSDGSFVHALDLNTGKELWRFKSTAPVWASPCIVNDKVIASINDGFIYCL